VSTEPGQTLSHYRLIEKIGEGGMGVVWKAEDTVLSRTVAIKVLPADVSRDETRRDMFLKEAQLAAQIGDAHIVQVYEFGREGDLDFIVMEYVEGKPLTRIIHGRPLPPDAVADLGMQLATALARAHRRGLVHRDLKPANILVTADGDAKILDFGLAVLFERSNDSIASEDATRSLTEAESPGPGLAGTIPYMSPEQARGEPVDARSDIFSLGTILYEMTTGQRPFTGAVREEVLREILKARPVPPHELVPKLPVEIDRIISKALARRRSNRYQAMDDLAVDLRRLGRDLESGSSPSWGELGESARQAADPNTVLVFPFEIRARTPEPDFVGQAFAEAIAINLAPATQLKVLPVPRPDEVEGRGALGLARAAREMGAGKLVHGSLCRHERSVQVSMSLVNAADNRMVWGAQKTVEDGDLSTLATSIAADLEGHLGARPTRTYNYIRLLTGGPAMAASPVTIGALGAIRAGDLDSALAETKRLVEIFPDDPDAHALYAFALYEVDGARPMVATREAMERTFSRLSEVDPETPYADAIRAMLLGEREGKPRAAVDQFSRLLERADFSPSCRAWMLRNRAEFEKRIGRLDAALEDTTEAVRLDPVQPWNFYILSGVHLSARRFEEALTSARQGSALEPSDYRTHQSVGYALLELGRWDEAITTFSKAFERIKAQEPCAALAIALHSAGRAKEARAYAEKAASLADINEGAQNLARYWMLADDRPKAIRFLRRALELGLADVFFMLGFPTLHGDPEFEAIVAEVKKRAGKE
jgi:serine/threonine protein kinase/Flp pilus assembly protein TadD